MKVIYTNSNSKRKMLELGCDNTIKCSMSEDKPEWFTIALFALLSNIEVTMHKYSFLNRSKQLKENRNLRRRPHI